MNFSSLALYGSCARGDNKENSDIDMLAIHRGTQYEMLYLGNLNISAYPFDLALEKSKSGDLFMLHIVSESKIITDLPNAFKIIFDNFRYKENYTNEKKMAADLAWYLILNSKIFNDYSMLNRRLVWCVRTILIAESAERHEPLFSSVALANAYGGVSIYDLIEKKSSPTYSSSSLLLVKEILLEKKLAQPDFLNDALQYFRLTKNSVAVSTLLGANGEGY